jgi:ethanolamine utilization microcompartment shell protein EutS
MQFQISVNRHFDCSTNRESDMAGKSGGKGTAGGKTAMTPARAAAIQSHAAKTSGAVQKGSFSARAQAAAAVNVNTGAVPSAGAKK